jgi:peptidoglycan/LPS O-acetylase OafA/YrhL
MTSPASTSPASTSPASTGSASPPGGSSRLAGVDGLRAFAALWVLLFHIRAFSGATLPPGLDLFVRSGSTGVSLFLVLSGFCLYAPFAGGRLDRFRAGDFFRRRGRRLLPAYYASLLAVLAAYIWAGGRAGLPSLSAGELAGQAGTHATLTHQLFPSTFYGLNGAYWSLGLEWELYLTLPLLVIAARRFGIWRTLAVVAALTVSYRLALAAAVAAGAIGGGGVWATVVLPNFFLGRWSEFALGMCAAELHSRGLTGRWLRPIAIAAVLCAAVGLLVPDNPLSHVLFGVVFFALLCAVLARVNRTAAPAPGRSLRRGPRGGIGPLAAAGLRRAAPAAAGVSLGRLAALRPRRAADAARRVGGRGLAAQAAVPAPAHPVGTGGRAPVPPTKSPIAAGSRTPAAGRGTGAAASAEGGQMVRSA